VRSRLHHRAFHGGRRVLRERSMIGVGGQALGRGHEALANGVVCRIIE
jgi:hypothetical protein